MVGLDKFSLSTCNYRPKIEQSEHSFFSHLCVDPAGRVGTFLLGDDAVTSAVGGRKSGSVNRYLKIKPKPGVFISRIDSEGRQKKL